jgi:hypothetical protein
LLVAAGEGIRLLLDSGGDNPHPASKIPSNLRLFRSIDEPKSVSKLSEDRERLVRTNRKLKHQSLLVTIFGQERDSKLHRTPRRTRSDDLAIHSDLAPIRLYNTKEHLRDLRSAGAYQAEEAKDLARPNFEADILDKSGPGKTVDGEDRPAYLRFFLRTCLAP